MRKGITPVIAIVLLLMMTVAAGGAVFVWAQGIIGGQQEQAEQRLQTEITVRDLQCQAGGSSPEIDFFLGNTGDATVNAGEVTIFMYRVADDSLVTTTSASHADLEPGDQWNGDADFSDADMTAGDRYRIEFSFTNQGSYTVSDTCQAE